MERIREAARIAHRMERFIRANVAPWDFSDYQDRQPDYLRTWTEDISRNDAGYLVTLLDEFSEEPGAEELKQSITTF